MFYLYGVTFAFNVNAFKEVSCKASDVLFCRYLSTCTSHSEWCDLLLLCNPNFSKLAGIQMLALLVPVLISFLLEGPTLKDASKPCQNLHERSLQWLMKIGPQYPQVCTFPERKHCRFSGCFLISLFCFFIIRNSNLWWPNQRRWRPSWNLQLGPVSWHSREPRLMEHQWSPYLLRLQPLSSRLISAISQPDCYLLHVLSVVLWDAIGKSPYQNLLHFYPTSCTNEYLELCVLINFMSQKCNLDLPT